MSSDSLPVKMFNALASLKTALFLLLLIVIACIAGSLGYVFVYSSWWFIGMLCLLALSLSICTFRRFSVLFRRKKVLACRDYGSLLVHVSILLILGGGVLRGLWGEKGFVALSDGQMAGFMRTEAGRTIDLPFKIHLEKFVVERHPPDPEMVSPAEVLTAQNVQGQTVSTPVVIDGAQYVLGNVEGKEVYVRILKRIPDFTVDIETREVSSRSDELKNPALLLEMSTAAVTNNIWIFARHPGMPMLASGEPSREISSFKMTYDLYYEKDPRGEVKDYKSTLQILEHGVAVAGKTIEVNSPLTYKGYSIYQSGYDKDMESWSSLQVVKDPGVKLVYTGFAMLLVGLSMAFYLKPVRSGS